MMSRLTDINSDNSIIDQDNRARVDRLTAKVTRLKNIAIDFEEESRDHNRLLDDVDNSHDRTWNALSSGQDRLLGLINFKRRGKRQFCYTVLFFFVLMMIVYFWISRRA